MNATPIAEQRQFQQPTATFTIEPFTSFTRSVDQILYKGFIFRSSLLLLLLTQSNVDSLDLAPDSDKHCEYSLLFALLSRLDIITNERPPTSLRLCLGPNIDVTRRPSTSSVRMVLEAYNNVTLC